MPKDERARADVNRWMFWESAHWDQACAILVFERFVKGFFGRGGPDPVEVEKGLANFNRAAKVLDQHLKGRKFLCGDALSVADFSSARRWIMSPAGFVPARRLTRRSAAGMRTSPRCRLGKRRWQWPRMPAAA